MKKIYLPYLLLLLPVFTFAQGPLPSIRAAWKKVPNLAATAKINDHIGIIQVTLSDSSFELMAVDDKLTVLWRDSLKGCGVACGKFKGNILAISDSGYSDKKENINPYYAFLIDPASGKVILQNKIFEQKTKHQEKATAVFAADGNEFHLLIQQTDINYSWLIPYNNKIESLTIVSLNEKLQPTFLGLKIPDEEFLCLKMNNSGDVFLLTLRDKKNLNVRRYEHGSNEPSRPLTQICDDFDKLDLWGAEDDIVPSDIDENILYISIGHINANDDREILTAKFNFSVNKVQTVTEAFTHKHVKELENNYAAVNNDFPEAYLGSAKKQIRSHYIATNDGKLVTVSAEVYSVTLNNIQTFYGGGLLISCYDSDLKMLFQRIMPVYYASSFPLETSYTLEKNIVKIVSNTNLLSASGQLDLSTGKWLNLSWVYAGTNQSSKHIIWFNDTFVVPYVKPRAFSKNYTIHLVLSKY